MTDTINNVVQLRHRAAEAHSSLDRQLLFQFSGVMEQLKNLSVEIYGSSLPDEQRLGILSKLHKSAVFMFEANVSYIMTRKTEKIRPK